MITISIECNAPFSPRSLIDRIWSGVEWRLARSGIKGLAIDYDDGQHQSVQICVDWRSGYLAMSVMRFRESGSRIGFFYSRPPKGVVKQSGSWEARAIGNGCCLKLVRNLELARGPAESAMSLLARERAYGEMLQDHLGLTLDLVTRRDSGESEMVSRR
jgi:hypothetical protein